MTFNYLCLCPLGLTECIDNRVYCHISSIFLRKIAALAYASFSKKRGFYIKRKEKKESASENSKNHFF